jgi:hypothetical protein
MASNPSDANFVLTAARSLNESISNNGTAPTPTPNSTGDNPNTLFILLWCSVGVLLLFCLATIARKCSAIKPKANVSWSNEPGDRTSFFGISPFGDGYQNPQRGADIRNINSNHV